MRTRYDLSSNEKGMRMSVLFLILISLFFVPVFAADEQSPVGVEGKPVELTEQQFEQMNEDQKAQFFNTPQNVVKNIQFAERYFQDAAAFQRAREGAQQFLRTKYQAPYVLDPSAATLTYNAADGTLQSGKKKIVLKEYQNNPEIREIRAVRDDFIIITSDKTVTLSGTGVTDINYAAGSFFIKGSDGRSHSFEPGASATSRIAIEADGTVVVNGDATGSVKTAEGLFTFTLKNTRANPDDSDPQLVIGANGDIDVIDGDAEVDTPSLYLDGQFTKKGSDVLSYALYDLAAKSTKETVLVDKATGIGVISAGQARSKGESVLTHIDHLVAGPSDNPAFTPGSVLGKEEARETAAGIRRQPNPRTPNSAVVNIKKLPSGPVVNAEGKVRIVNFHVGPDGAVPHRDAIDETRPQFVGLSDATEIHYTVDGQREFVDVSGAAQYADQQMNVEQKAGARLQKNAALHGDTKDVLTLSCSGCAAGEAFTIRKHAALITKGGERHGYDVTRAGVDVVYSFEGGKLVVDPTQVSLQASAGMIENPRSSRLAFDKQLYIKVENQDDVFAIGGNNIAMYQSGSAPPVSVVLNSKNALGEPTLFDSKQLMFGIDPTKLNNQQYVGAVERALNRQDEVDALRRQIKQQYGADFADSGACQNKACSDKLQASLGKGDAFAQAYVQLRRLALTSESDLNNALAVAARADGKSTAFVKKSNTQIQKQLKGLAGIEANWRQQQRAAEETAAYESVRKEDTGRSVAVGLQLKEVDAALALKQKELDAAKQKLKIAKTPEEAGTLAAALTYGRRIFTTDSTEQDLVEALAAVRWYEEDVRQLSAQKAKLSQEVAELTARHEKGNPEALISILTNVGETEQAKTLALQLAQQADAARATASGIKEYKQLEGLRERAFLLASVACSKGGDAGCAEEELAKISNPDLKEKARAAKHKNIDVKLAKDAFYAAQGAMMDEIEKHIGFMHERDEVPWFFTSTSKAWESTDKRYEEATVRQALNKQRAAYATLTLIEQGKTLKDVYSMSHDDMRRAVDNDDIGDMTSFKAEQLRYDVAIASGNGLTAQQKFDIIMRKAENKVLSEHGDEKAAEEDYLQAVREFSGTADVRPALAALQRIDADKELKVSISPLEPLLGDGFGFNTGIKLPFSSQEVGRFASEMLDVSWVLDAAPVVKIGAKLAVSSIKLRRAAELAKLGMTEAEILAKLNQPGRAAALLQRAQQGVAGVMDKAPVFLKRQRDISLTSFGRDMKNQINTALGEIQLLERAGFVQEAQDARKVLADLEKISHADGIYKMHHGGVIGSSKRAVAAAAKAPVRVAEAGVQRLPRPMREFVATTAQQFSDTLASRSRTYASMQGVERGVERGIGRVGEDISTGYARVRSAAEQFKRAKASGDVGELLKASDHLIEAERGIQIEYFVDAFAQQKITSLVGEAQKAARAGATTVTPELSRAAAQLLDDAGSFAANIDIEVEQGRALLKCASPCELTPDGQALLEEAHTLPDTVADMVTSFRTLPPSDVDAGLAVMDSARAAEMGADPTRVVSGAALDDLVGSVEVNPKLSGAAQARAVDDAIVSRSLPNEIAREELKSMKPFPEVQGYRARLVNARDEKTVYVSLGRLKLIPKEQRIELWVDSQTGEIVAHGPFSKVRHLAGDPNLQLITVTPSPFGGFETSVNLDNFLTPRGRKVFETTMDEFARINPPSGRAVTSSDIPSAKVKPAPATPPQGWTEPGVALRADEFPALVLPLPEKRSVNLNTGRQFLSEGSLEKVLSPDNIIASGVPSGDGFLAGFHVDTATGNIRVYSISDDISHLPDGFTVGQFFDARGKPKGWGLVKDFRGGKGQEETVAQHLIERFFNKPFDEVYMQRYFSEKPGGLVAGAVPPATTVPATLIIRKAKPAVTIRDANAEMLKSAYEKAGTIDERVRLASVDIAKTEMVTGEKLFEIKGRHLGQDGKPIGTLQNGLSFDHNIIVLTDGTVSVQRRFGLHPSIDPDGTLTAKIIRDEDEQLAAALRSMSAVEYHTVPSHDLELVTLCRLHSCTIDAPRVSVLDDIEKWVSSDEAAAWFEQTADGINWVEQHRAGGMWAGIKRLFGRETIDLEGLTNSAFDYPVGFLKGKKYPVTVGIRRAPVPEVTKAEGLAKAPEAAQAGKAAVPPAAPPAASEITEGALLEARTAAAPLSGRELTLLERPDIPERIKAELRALGVKNARSVEGRAKLLTRAVEPNSLADKVLGAVRGGESGVRATIVEKADGSLVVWKVDSGNPLTTVNLHRDRIIGIEDGGRRQLAMAGILDEFDSVVVPGMRRIQFSDGHGVIETNFVDGYGRLGKNSQEQFGRLEELLRSKAITPDESREIVAKAQEQALVNIVFGAGDVELGFVRLPHAPGTPASEYVKIVRFDEENAFLGLLDYGVLHENVNLDSLHGVLSSGNDWIYGMFKAEDYVTKGVFDIEKLRRTFMPVVENLEGILSREAAFTARLQRAGYTSDEALMIYNNARKNLKALKDELAVGSPGGLLEKMITQEGNLLATSRPGVFMSVDERLDKGLMPLQRRNTLARGNMDPARATKQGVVGEFVPRNKRVLKATVARSLTPRERSMIGFVETSGLSVDYKNAWNAAKAGKDVKIKRYSDYYRAKYAGDNAYLADGILAEARPEFAARIDAIADEFNALPLAEQQGRVDKFIGRMEEVIQGKAAKATEPRVVSPEIVAANRAAVGKSADDINIKGALEELTVPITCKVPFVGAAVKVAKSDSECSQFVVKVTSLADFKRADRISAYRVEKGKSPFEILYRGEDEGAVKSYVEASKNVRSLESETDTLLSQMIRPHTVKKEIENQIKDLKSLEELALETYGSKDYRYRRIRFKRIALDSKYDDPVINPYVEITEEHKRIARSFFPTHKPRDLDALMDIIESGGLHSPKRRGLNLKDERLIRSQDDSIYLSAGPPYSHLKTESVGVIRHDIPLIVFDREKIYANPSFRATPRDSFAYDTVVEMSEYSLANHELVHFIELLSANTDIPAEISDFAIRPDRIVKFGTFFPEITNDGEIKLDAIAKIILTKENKFGFLSKLREHSKFQNLAGKKLKSNLEVEAFLRENFGIELIIPDDGFNVDQMYWKIIGLPVPVYAS